MKKLIVVGLAAVALALTGCGASNTDWGTSSPHNDRTYCDGNVYTPVDEDDYTCSKNGVVYFEGDHEDDSKKKKSSKGAAGPVGPVGSSGSWFKPKSSTPKSNSGYKPSTSYKAPSYKAPSSSSKSYSYKK